MAPSRPVFIAGSALASTLGADLAAAVRRVATGDLPVPAPRPLVGGESWPHFALAVPPADDDWYGRARALIGQALAEAGVVRRDVPLFVASSSLSIGAIERDGDAGGDCLNFCERLAGWFDWQGPLYWINTACTSSLNALRSAQRLIESGACEAAVVLGLELDNRYSAAGFAAMQLLSPTRPQPLAARRDGLVLGEAVAVIRLAVDADETCSDARPTGASSACPTGIPSACKKIGATPLSAGRGSTSASSAHRWRLRGGGNCVDGADPAGASATAVSVMAAQALREAGLGAGEIDLIKLQAAGSPHNDAAEIAGLRAVFAELPALVSLKPWLGHTLGAAGAAELALLIGCLQANVWPAAPETEADPAIDARLANAAPPRQRHLMAIILGFGGGHSAVILEDTAAIA